MSDSHHNSAPRQEDHQLHHPLEHFVAPLSPAEVDTSRTDSPFFPPSQPTPTTISDYGRRDGRNGTSTGQHSDDNPLATSSQIGRPDPPLHPSIVETSASGGRARVDEAGFQDWEDEFQRQRFAALEAKVKKDLEGWRGGHGTLRSSYPRGALPTNSYYHQPISGTIGKHLPKEIVRVERDWSGGEVCQFESAYPMELDNRIEPKRFMEFIDGLNEIMRNAYSVKGAIWDNLLAVGTFWTSLLWRTSHFERELQRAEHYIQDANHELFNPQGLDVQSPRGVALQFLEIEYY